MVKTRRTKRYHGSATVEAALLLPLLFLLTFGVIEYGWLFLKANETISAARHAARAAIRPDATSADVLTAVQTLMTSAGMEDSGYQVTISPEDISSLEVGTPLTVLVTVPYEGVAILNLPLLPKPANLQGSVTMAKEGP